MELEKDYGSDPLGNGMFKMVPSGDVVDLEERNRRLPLVDFSGRQDYLIGSKTAFQVEMMQGGKLNK